MFYLKRFFIFICMITSLTAFMPTVSFAEHEGRSHDVAAKYYCPMHPQVISDKPGDCPICHMRLVLNNPSNRGESKPLEGRIPVIIPDSTRNQLGIQTYVVEIKPLQKTIETWGRVAHDPELYALQIDFLREERLNYERERAPTVYSQKRELTARERIRIKFLDMGLSPEWIEALKAAGVPDKRLLYHHSASGFWAYLQIREKDSLFVKSGEAVTLRVAALQNTKLEGNIEFVDSKVDMETGTIRARVLVQNIPLDLKPDMVVNGSILANLGNTLVVPEDALLFTGNRVIVFVDEKGVFKPREVILGAKANGYYEIKEGLMPGEKVALNGNFFIDSESRLRASVASATHGSHTS